MTYWWKENHHYPLCGPLPSSFNNTLFVCLQHRGKQFSSDTMIPHQCSAPSRSEQHWLAVMSALSASKQHWQSCLREVHCQVRFTCKHCSPGHTGMYSEHCKFVTALFDIWGWNGYLTIVLHFSTQAGACYIIWGWGQISLNQDFTVCKND
jgi:hypothetical protein